jgi:hypothetical protein
MLPADDSKQANGTEDQTVSGNLIPPILGLLGIGLLACGVWIVGLSDNPSSNAFSQCSAIADDRTRLGCYDQLATPHQPAKGAIAPLHSRSKEDSQ